MGQNGIRNAMKQSNAMVMKSSKNNSFGAKPTAHNGLVGGSSPPGPTNVFNSLQGLFTSLPCVDQRYDQRNGLAATDCVG